MRSRREFWDLGKVLSAQFSFLDGTGRSYKMADLMCMVPVGSQNVVSSLRLSKPSPLERGEGICSGLFSFTCWWSDVPISEGLCCGR
ncbi:hypothetical protein CBR_g40883 [Chara braunii]|uniref:Uncharacterized protein n=1 Tax=Chara braunii TaxID=69332 RepID=A0A388K2K0_CHABU|nr:hypothetical protein CBR_g40883 [Chara braunii]|eukprot:GBG64183.1 hypothetical protein CBR_g40883 [Chara braunii]